eukprot:549420_1
MAGGWDFEKNEMKSCVTHATMSLSSLPKNLVSLLSNSSEPYHNEYDIKDIKANDVTFHLPPNDIVLHQCPHCDQYVETMNEWCGKCTNFLSCWLRDIHMDQHYKYFRKNEFKDVDDILNADDKGLQKIGIQNAKHREIILSNAKEYVSGDLLLPWLESIDMKQYGKTFKDSGFKYITQIDNYKVSAQDLVKLGVSKDHAQYIKSAAIEKGLDGFCPCGS